MNFNVPYGKKSIIIDIPEKNLLPIIYSSNSSSSNSGKFLEMGKKTSTSKGEYSCDHDSVNVENTIIEEALKNPFSSAGLSDLAYEKNKVVILVSDITRPCPSYKFLPFIISELKKAKVKGISVIFGLGIHRSHTEQERVKLAGMAAAENCKLLDSDQNRCRLLGTTSYGTPVEVFEEVKNCDFLIATGNIEYHYFAGYSGGAKALMPGVCSRKSVSANHSMMLEESARAGEFYDNPLRQDIEEAGKLAGINFIFNVIIDDAKHIIGAVAGKNNEAYIEGIKKYDSIYEIKIKEKADIVITSPGGYPKDINLYQAQKALESVKDIVKENGTVILVAECPEGFGEDIFEEWMKDVADFDKLYKDIKREFVLGGHKAVAMSKLLTRTSVYAYADSQESKVCDMGFSIVENIQEFIDNAISKNSDTKIAVVPNGRFIKYAQN